MREVVEQFFLRRIRGDRCQMYVDTNDIYLSGRWEDVPTLNLPLKMGPYEAEFRMMRERMNDPDWEYELNEYQI